MTRRPPPPDSCLKTVSGAAQLPSLTLALHTQQRNKHGEKQSINTCHRKLYSSVKCCGRRLVNLKLVSQSPPRRLKILALLTYLIE